MTNQFNESDHRRDQGGKFADKQHGVPTKPLGVPTSPIPDTLDAASSFAVSERDRERFVYKGDNITLGDAANMVDDGEARFQSEQNTLVTQVGTQPDLTVHHFFEIAPDNSEDRGNYVYQFTSVRSSADGQSVSARMKPGRSADHFPVTVRITRDGVTGDYQYKRGKRDKHEYLWVDSNNQMIRNYHSHDGRLIRQSVRSGGDFGSVDFDERGVVRRAADSYWLTNPSYKPPYRPQPVLPEGANP